jgi:hypothetical protein
MEQNSKIYLKEISWKAMDCITFSSVQAIVNAVTQPTNGREFPD